MKDYSKYAHASISMSKDQLFIDTLDQVIKNNNVKYIIESGTYMGTGSTKTIADILLKNKAPLSKFYTIEVDNNLFRKAKKNLKKYSFVEPIWGLSVDPDEAVEFIKTDDAINHHEKYPDVFIDTLVDPAQFYTGEIKGQLSQISRKQGFFEKLFKDNSLLEETFRTNVFKDLLPIVQDANPIILLDSAGGIGMLEFNTVLNFMKDKKFILILDDIHHLKHFRSLAHIENSPNFSIINKSVSDGWVIASHTP